MSEGCCWTGAGCCGQHHTEDLPALAAATSRTDVTHGHTDSRRVERSHDAAGETLARSGDGRSGDPC